MNTAEVSASHASDWIVMPVMPHVRSRAQCHITQTMPVGSDRALFSPFKLPDNSSVLPAWVSDRLGKTCIFPRKITM